jgi:hypothetical protein
MSEKESSDELQKNKNVLMDMLMEFGLEYRINCGYIDEQRKVIEGLEIDKSTEPCQINNMGITSLIEMSKIMENASESELFVFDYDDTLASLRCSFWEAGLVKYEKRDRYDVYIPIVGFNEVMSFSTSRNVLILTARGIVGIPDVNQFMKEYGYNVRIIGTCRRISKGNMMRNILAASPKYTVVHFIDDCEKNIRSVEKSISKHFTGITLYTYLAPPLSHDKSDINVTQEEREERKRDYLVRSRKY